MRDGVMDSCTVREDVSRSVGLNGGAGSLVESRQDLYMFIVDLTLGKVCCIFEYSTFLLNTLIKPFAQRILPRRIPDLVRDLRPGLTNTDSTVPIPFIWG